MILEVPSYNKSSNNRVSKFTVDDMKSISFMIENDSDQSLYNFLSDKVVSHCDGFDKFVSLLDARIKYIDTNIIFNNGSSDITYNLNIWKDVLLEKYKSIDKTIKFENIVATVGYPTELFFQTPSDIILSVVRRVQIGEKSVDFKNLSKEDKIRVLEKLPYGIVDEIKEFILSNGNPVILMESKLGLPEISINFFDNSAFSVLKTVFSYYSYDDITELIFILSKRIPDASFLLNGTPRDLTFLSKLYSEEVEKDNLATN